MSVRLRTDNRLEMTSVMSFDGLNLGVCLDKHKDTENKQVGIER